MIDGKQDESGIAAAHRAIGAAAMGFSAGDCLEALSMIVAEIVVNYIKEDQRPFVLRKFDAAVRVHVRDVRAMLDSLELQKIEKSSLT